MNIGDLIDRLSDALYFGSIAEVDQRARDAYKEYAELLSCTEDKILDDPQNLLNVEFNDVFSGEKIVVSRKLFDELKQLAVDTAMEPGGDDYDDLDSHQLWLDAKDTAQSICLQQHWEFEDHSDEDEDEEEEDWDDYLDRKYADVDNGEEKEEQVHAAEPSK